MTTNAIIRISDYRSTKYIQMPYKILEGPVISIQSDWNDTLRYVKGEAWVSCKNRGQNSVHGKITRKDASRGAPEVSASDPFKVDNISKSTIRVKHVPSNNVCIFVAPDMTYTGIHSKGIISGDVTANGLCVSACTDNKLHVWDIKSGIIRRTLDGHVGNVYKCRFFPSGVVVLSGGADMQLKIWSAETGQCPVTLSSHTGAITDFSIIEKGRNIISVSKDGFAKLWDCGLSSCLDNLISHTSAINCCCLCVANKSIEIGEPDVASCEREIGTKDKLLLVGCEDGSIIVTAVWSRKKILSQKLESAVNCIASVDDQYLVGCQNGQILLFKIENRVFQPILCWFESNSSVSSILSYKDTGFFIGRADGSCIFYELLHCNEQRIQLTGPDCDPVYDIAFDGTFIYTASRDAIMRKYNVAKVIQSTFHC